MADLPKWSIKRQGIITSLDDLLELDIIDFYRTNGVFRNQRVAMDDIASVLSGRTAYTVAHCPLFGFPERDDWPNWKHEGNHEHTARMYWDAFHALFPQSELTLSDSPDFQGILRYADGTSAFFWGDIGRVSVSAFAYSMRVMKAHDLWISIQADTQIILEPQVTFSEPVDAAFEEIIMGRRQETSHLPEHGSFSAKSYIQTTPL